MKILGNLDGNQITSIVVTTVVAIALVFSISILKSCTIEESEMFLKAGCEKTYVPGRTEAVWSNCKRPVETPQ
jgi:hypothetical protein